MIQQARTYLEELEQDEPRKETVRMESPAEREEQISFVDLGADEVRDTLREVDLNTLTPLEAMNLLYKLQKKVKEQ